VRWEVVREQGYFEHGETVIFMRDYEGCKAGTICKVARSLGQIIGDPVPGRRYTIVMVESKWDPENIPEILLFSVPEEVLERLSP